MIGLVLSGGGARGAYQVGVLKTVAEVCERWGLENPFAIINGVSAGAINAAKLASYQKNISESIYQLEQLWSRLRSEDIFLTDAGSLGKIGLKLFGKLSLGGLMGVEEGQSLLDTTPLQKLLTQEINYQQIDDNIKQGKVHALCISALDYKYSILTSFVHCHKNVPLWQKPRKVAEVTQIT
ncbi:MAG: patatin-like phospholipase family protein, partial [Bdellovibrionaceae bacterium]|nr:patatin-like phospholipase family protein [Pseudobdellovibrionaceae bacterium]MDW8191296.1 patatin-like phospholipase family protein [Pseudobdellovibrionaceae bacterium]